MKKQRSSKKYPAEFKKDAVVLVLEQGYTVTQAAEEVGVEPKLLYNWKAKIEADCASTPTQDEKAELIALRKENKRLRLEQEILKKASAFFASRALPPSPSCMEESGTMPLGSGSVPKPMWMIWQVGSGTPH